jgi:hypothetical protein
MPGPRSRYASLLRGPQHTVHLKYGVTAAYPPTPGGEIMTRRAPRGTGTEDASVRPAGGREEGLCP